MYIYILRYLEVDKFGTPLTFTDSYELEDDCYKAAVAKAESIFVLNTNVLNYFYKDFASYVALKQFKNALKCFNDWGLPCTPSPERKQILVIQSYLNPAKVSSIEIDGNISDKSKTINQNVIDVPCKVCGRNVNSTEATCWNCGVSNPASK